MRSQAAAAAALLLLWAASPAGAQALNDPVVASPDPEALFTSPDPTLNANKQVALKIVKELLEANQWDRAPRYLTERYIQHNPFAASGLKGVMHYFIDVAKRQPSPVPEKMKTKVVAVQAEGDYVTVSYVREMKDPKDSAKSYTTTWFDMWRFKDGKADEHWDPAVLPAASAQDGEVTAQTLTDRAEIQDLLTRYYYNLGHGSADSFSRFYADGAEFILGPKSYQGKEGIEKAYEEARQARPGPKPFSFNVSLSNPLIVVHGDSATAELIFTEIAIDTEGATPHLLAQGREFDDLVKVGGEWRFKKRQILPGAQVPAGWPG